MLLHWSVRATHVVHEDHCVRDLVQVHAHCCLDVKTDAGPATLASLCYFQVLAQQSGDEVRSVHYSVGTGDTSMRKLTQKSRIDSLSQLKPT